MNVATIRHATEDDLGAILDIFNHVITSSTAVYSMQPVTREEREAWFAARKAAGFPVLVADTPEGVAGYCSFGEFRPGWNVCRYTVEHSVHVHPGFRRCGIGSQLIRSLIPLAEGMGKHVMVGAIDAANEPSLKMHEQLGFQQVASFKEVGNKFDRWLDLVFVQRVLTASV